jgi:hypothetical protein
MFIFCLPHLLTLSALDLSFQPCPTPPKLSVRQRYPHPPEALIILTPKCRHGQPRWISVLPVTAILWTALPMLETCRYCISYAYLSFHFFLLSFFYTTI